MDGQCGAWTFNGETLTCSLHDIDACCGQLVKRVKSDISMSGYHCPICWSTIRQCPCTNENKETEEVHDRIAADSSSKETTAVSRLKLICLHS